MMLIIGLTGTTGSGKGYVSSFLADEKTLIIDTDKVYHEMICYPGKCVDALVSEFGSEILDENGGINRRKLAGIVFSDETKLASLNGITHRMILERTRDIISASESKDYVIIDAPLLFESGFDKECDVIVAVVAPADIRVERIIRRDSITCESALERIRNQKNDEFFKENCDYVICNDGKDISGQIDQLKSEMKRLYGKKEKKEIKEKN